MRTIKVKTKDEFISRLSNFETLEMADALVESITRGLKNNNKKVQVCDVLVEEEGEVLRLSSAREDWPTALNGCINAYVKIEAYEKCITVQNLLKEYESKKLVAKLDESNTTSKRGRKNSN